MALTTPVARHLLPVGFLLGLGAAPVLGASPEDGRRAYDAGHFADAMGIWGELSRHGSAEAAFGLGLLYDLGNGTATNPEAAFFWYRKAAEAGLPAAQFNVGAMYDSGRGVARSSENAALWYAKAAAHEHHRAEFDLGLLYALGEGVPLNADAAAAWLREAADGGVPAAEARLKALKGAAPKRPDGALAAVSLASPARNANLPAGADGSVVELVWVAPAEPEPVHYEVQVREFGGSDLRTVFTASLTATAALVRLPAAADFYVWNVATVGRDGARAPSDWNWFSVAPLAGQSVTAQQGGAAAGR